MIEPHDPGLWFGETGALIEYSTPVDGIQAGEVSILVEYAGDAISYTANLPSMAEVGILVEYAEPATDVLSGEAGVLVEFAEAAEGVYLGEAGVLLEYAGDAISYTANLPSFAEVGILVEFNGWISEGGGPPPEPVSAFGPGAWVM